MHVGVACACLCWGRCHLLSGLWGLKERKAPLTLEVMVLGWCVLAFYIVGVFCYLSAN